MVSAGNRIYMAIDLKFFYASVECVERALDPLNTNLVVADSSKTEKTDHNKKYGYGHLIDWYKTIYLNLLKMN